MEEIPSNPIVSKEPEKPTNPAAPTVPPDPVDPAFWFKEIRDELIARFTETSSDSYPDIADPGGFDVAGAVNYQYVCDAINWGAALAPESGDEEKAADCKYFLETIDLANGGTTNFGTSAYATNQVIDQTAVDLAVETLLVRGGKFIALSGSEAAYSTDGSTWMPMTMPGSGYWDIAYGGY
jgi:hypothetical protein